MDEPRLLRFSSISTALWSTACINTTGHRVTAEEAARLQRVHAEAYARQVGHVRALPGARELLGHLTQTGVPWAIATSGRMESAAPALKILG